MGNIFNWVTKGTPWQINFKWVKTYHKCANMEQKCGTYYNTKWWRTPKL
jgi:hypothetical protein